MGSFLCLWASLAASYEEMLSPAIPAEPHDKGAEWLVTERELIRCGKDGAPSLGARASALKARLKSLLTPAEGDADAAGTTTRPKPYPPLLVLATFLLLNIIETNYFAKTFFSLAKRGRELTLGRLGSP